MIVNSYPQYRPIKGKDLYSHVILPASKISVNTRDDKHLFPGVDGTKKHTQTHKISYLTWTKYHTTRN